MIKIFIQNVTSLDFAFLTTKSGPIGKSYYLDAIFEGKTNQKGMIIDFTLAKKIVKLAVAEIDHKLIVSRKHIKYKTRSHLIVLNSFQYRKKITNFFAMHANKNWIKIVSQAILDSLEMDSILKLEKFIAKTILKFVPKNISKVLIKLKEYSELSKQNINHFHYTHTLCHHTGNCQRFHGHSAQVQIFQNDTFSSNLSHDSAKKMNGLYIISMMHLRPHYNSKNLELIKKHCFKKNNFENIKENLNAFEYKGSKGKVSIVISKHLSLILPNESTIENITQYIHTQLSNKHQTEVRTYEGLSKGAVVS